MWARNAPRNTYWLIGSAAGIHQKCGKYAPKAIGDTPQEGEVKFRTVHGEKFDHGENCAAGPIGERRWANSKRNNKQQVGTRFACREE